MGRPLHDLGLGLANQGDIDQQSIAGAVGTGTHGTGRTLQNLSAKVKGHTLVTADGTIVTADATSSPELLLTSRLHPGAFGLITRVQVECRAAYKLQQHGGQVPYEQIQPDLNEFVASNRHFEFFWYPQSDLAVTKFTNETTDSPQYPVAEEGARCAWSYEVLPNYRPHKHTEMEYSVPAEVGQACFEDIRRLLRIEFPGVRWPVEYRTLAADDV